MSDKMTPIPFKKLLDWVFEEYKQTQSVFGIAETKFYRKTSDQHIRLFGEALDTPVGPAAGPHTQLAQNIIAAYLSGSRFLELKSVQIMDELEFPKPCILAEDEGYNTEWSTELPIMGAFREYVKAWFVLHVLQKELFNQSERRFMFNMSVGYDLKGIQSPKVDQFIEGLKDASGTEIFKECQASLLENIDQFKKIDRAFVETISPQICTSITLSTMHGCPPAEIEAIIKYLLREKRLHTFVKMNPTLLGYEYVRNTFAKMGYSYIQLKEESFTHDLRFKDGLEMLKRLQGFALEQKKEFGVKLSNTLPVKIGQAELPGEEMYLSGRALYPLTINLAYKLAAAFEGDLRISYSGGADAFNIERIFATGIRPITVATTLLKPGGYLRLKQLAEILEPQLDNLESSRIDLEKLNKLAESALEDVNHLKEKRDRINRKIELKLPMTSCFIAPCSIGCPIEQDIPEYLRLVGEKRYEEAYEVIVAKNPLPFITGTICTHNCMTKCTRLEYDESVQIRGQKLIAAQKGHEGFMRKISGVEPLFFTKVAVIGAGPSGLAAAYFLARAGLDVTVFDKREKAGGTVEYVIPDFRISREAIRKDIELSEKMGVKFEFGIDPFVSVAEYKAKGFRYVYLAIGAGKTKALEITGDTERVRGAISYLEEFKANQATVALKLGKNVAVVGGGNSAMDAARAALRAEGVEKVYIVYRRTQDYMPADKEELRSALEEGVIFKELLSPISLTGGVLKCQAMKLGEADASGRRSPVVRAGVFEELPIDTVLAALGEVIDYDLLKSNGIALGERGEILVNEETLETSVSNVFIGGDALLGPSTVVKAIAQGTKAAKAILEKEQIALRQEFPARIAFDNEKQLSEIADKKGVMRSVRNDEQETGRCLECNKVCNICAEVCPNRANLLIPVPGLSNRNQILHVDGMCNECGNCATFCPYSSEPYKVKLTLFWNDAGFMASSNSGFLILQGGTEPMVKLRLDGKIIEVKFDESGKPDVSLENSLAAMIWIVINQYRYLYLGDD